MGILHTPNYCRISGAILHAMCIFAGAARPTPLALRVARVLPNTTQTPDFTDILTHHQKARTAIPDRPPRGPGSISPPQGDLPSTEADTLDSKHAADFVPATSAGLLAILDAAQGLYDRLTTCVVFTAQPTMSGNNVTLGAGGFA